MAGVAECWLILAERRLVEVHRNPVDGAYRDRQILTVTDTLKCQVLPGIEVSLENLFRDL